MSRKLVYHFNTKYVENSNAVSYLLSGIERVEDGMFKKNDKIEVLRIPDNVRSIGKESFYMCQDLSAVFLSEGLESIGESAFFGCTELRKLELPCTLKKVGKDAFAYCPELKEVTLHSNCKFDRFAFCYSGIKSLIIYNIDNFSESVFVGCHDLEKVVICGGSKISSSMFRDCKSLKYVEIADSVLEIGQFAFEGCVALEHIVVPSSVVSIGDRAFHNTGLKSVSIPNSTKINNSFDNNVSIRKYERNNAELLNLVIRCVDFTNFSNLERIQATELIKKMIDHYNELDKRCNEVKKIVNEPLFEFDLEEKSES